LVGGLAVVRVRRQGEDVLNMSDGPPACLSGHGRAVLVHWSAPGDDGRGKRRRGRVRLVRGPFGVPGGRLRWGAAAMGLGA
jgi:hypothetical protein